MADQAQQPQFNDFSDPTAAHPVPSPHGLYGGPPQQPDPGFAGVQYHFPGQVQQAFPPPDVPYSNAFPDQQQAFAQPNIPYQKAFPDQQPQEPAYQQTFAPFSSPDHNAFPAAAGVGAGQQPHVQHDYGQYTPLQHNDSVGESPPVQAQPSYPDQNVPGPAWQGYPMHPQQQFVPQAGAPGAESSSEVESDEDEGQDVAGQASQGYPMHTPKQSFAQTGAPDAHSGLQEEIEEDEEDFQDQGARPEPEEEEESGEEESETDDEPTLAVPYEPQRSKYQPGVNPTAATPWPQQSAPSPVPVSSPQYQQHAPEVVPRPYVPPIVTSFTPSQAAAPPARPRPPTAYPEGWKFVPNIPVPPPRTPTSPRAASSTARTVSTQSRYCPKAPESLKVHFVDPTPYQPSPGSGSNHVPEHVERWVQQQNPFPHLPQQYKHSVVSDDQDEGYAADRDAQDYGDPQRQRNGVKKYGDRHPHTRDSRRGAADAYYDQNQLFGSEQGSLARPNLPYDDNYSVSPVDTQVHEPKDPYEHSLKDGLLRSLNGYWRLLRKDPKLTEHTGDRYELLRRTEKLLNNGGVAKHGKLNKHKIGRFKEEMDELAKALEATSSQPRPSGENVREDGGRISHEVRSFGEHTRGPDCWCLHTPRICDRRGHSTREHICGSRACRPPKNLCARLVTTKMFR